MSPKPPLYTDKKLVNWTQQKSTTFRSQLYRRIGVVTAIGIGVIMYTAIKSRI